MTNSWIGHLGARSCHAEQIFIVQRLTIESRRRSAPSCLLLASAPVLSPARRPMLGNCLLPTLALFMPLSHCL